MKEVWKDVIGYEEIYEINNKGEVRNKIRMRMVKARGDKDGYLRVHLNKDGKQKLFGVHRLVATNFIPNPNNYPQVNHKDENKQNNNVENLEWCTFEYNNSYGTKNERIAKSHCKKVGRYSLDGELLETYSSLKEAGLKGYDKNSICFCCNGKLRTHRGFIWKHI